MIAASDPGLSIMAFREGDYMVTAMVGARQVTESQVTGVSDCDLDAAVRDGLGQAAALGLPAATAARYRITRVASAVVAGVAWYYIDPDFTADSATEFAAEPTAA